MGAQIINRIGQNGWIEISASIVIYDDQPDRYNKYCNSYELREFNMNAFMIYMFVWMEIHVQMHSWRK